MRSRLLLNLVLLLVIIVLGVLAFNATQEQDKTPATRLTDLAPAEVTRIELQRQGEQSLSLYREQGIWYMSAPFQMEANDYRVQALLRLLQAQYSSQNPLGDRDPAVYGLDEPRATLVFNDSLTIEFGDTEPLSKQRYLRIDDQLYLVADTHYYQAVSPATGYLSHALLPPGKITNIELPDLHLALHDGQWHSDPPREDRSADAFTELVANWRAAQALRLEPADNDTLPGADIRVELDNRDEPVMFSLQHKDDQIMLLRHDVHMRYVIDETIRDQLLQLPTTVDKPEPEN